jgi:hypothetical protein
MVWSTMFTFLSHTSKEAEFDHEHFPLYITDPLKASTSR